MYRMKFDKYYNTERFSLEGLTQLEFLNTAQSPLCWFELRSAWRYFFRDLHSLKHLDLSYCDIVNLDSEAFTNLQALEFLDLSNNKLWNFDQVESCIFQTLPALAYLTLNANMFSVISASGQCYQHYLQKLDQLLICQTTLSNAVAETTSQAYISYSITTTLVCTSNH
jgi:Leucine-rich repeat (LRR) protein